MKLRRTPSGKVRRKPGTKKLAAAPSGDPCDACDCIPDGSCGFDDVDGPLCDDRGLASYPVTFGSIVVDALHDLGFTSFSGTYCVTAIGPCFWGCVLAYPDIPFDVTYRAREVLDGGGDEVADKSIKRCGAELVIGLQKTTATSGVLTVDLLLPGLPTVGLFSKNFTTTAGQCFPTSPMDNDYTSDGQVVRTVSGRTTFINYGYGGSASIGSTTCTRCDTTSCGQAGAKASGIPAGDLYPPAYNDGAIRWFRGPSYQGYPILTFPAGECIITYLCGALSYDHANEGFRVNDGAALYNVVDSIGNVVVAAPGGSTQYSYQSQVEYHDSLATATFTHTGGQLGIRLDDATYANNALDTTDPVSAGGSFRVCCGPLCYEVNAHISDDTVELFNAGSVFPAGDYELSYVSGALTYSDGSAGGAQGFRVNTGGIGGEPGYFLTDESGTNMLGSGVNAPGTNSQQLTQADVETASAGDSITFTLASDSKLGIQLRDAGAYGDNALDSGGTPPRFRICPVTP